MHNINLNKTKWMGGGVYCYANVGMSVGPSVDHMSSADYLENYLSQSLHNSHSDWS
jgi:hypothetical protein